MSSVNIRARFGNITHALTQGHTHLGCSLDPTLWVGRGVMVLTDQPVTCRRGCGSVRDEPTPVKEPFTVLSAPPAMTSQELAAVVDPPEPFSLEDQADYLEARAAANIQPSAGENAGPAREFPGSYTDHHAGDLAYLLAGEFGTMIPVKVLMVTEPGAGDAGPLDGQVRIQVTAANEYFRRGAQMPAPTSNVVPRTHVKRKPGQTPAINRAYVWRTQTNEAGTN